MGQVRPLECSPCLILLFSENRKGKIDMLVSFVSLFFPLFSEWVFLHWGDAERQDKMV